MFKIDFIGGVAVEWDAGGERRVNKEYSPSFYVSGPRLKQLRPRLMELGAESTVLENWRTSLGGEKERVLRVDTAPGELRSLASRIRKEKPRDRYRYFNVDLTPQFRYSLEEERIPAPEEELERMNISMPEKAIASGSFDDLKVDGNASTPEKLEQKLETQDPDILIVNHGALIPMLQEEIELGRIPGMEKLAGKNTFESYGRTGFSPSRFNVPGRAVVNRSNSFFLEKTGFEGIMDMVERSWKPVQEAAWSSIGSILTAIEVRKAFRERSVLVPWEKWRPEEFKSAKTLHDADRGGFIFQPEVGTHENVHELDFSSLYPNIMIEKNISPETLGKEGRKVPGLGYSIGDAKGFIPQVLEPLVEDRDRIKKKIEEAEGEKKEKLEQRSDAIKWVLVSCFGYQGYRNAKFGRIEAHEAINAYAREIMLEAKQVFEENGYHVIHGIIDSIWVKKVDEKAVPVEKLAEEVSSRTGIELEYERKYDWISFVPRRDSRTGTLNRYFGRHGEGYKIRGVEARQRSTPSYIKDAQMTMIEALDSGPEKAIQVLEDRLERLESAPTDSLVITGRATKRIEEYSRNSRTLAALKRYRDHGIEKNPGEDVRFVVVDDSLRDRDRVRIEFEQVNRFDTEFYTEMILRAAESVLSPLGWSRKRIENELSDSRVSELAEFY